MPKPPVRRGATLIELVIVVGVVTTLIGLLLPAVQSSRQAASRIACQNNLRQLGLALHNYEAANGYFPPGTDSRSDPNRYRFLSWHARILPYLDQADLWNATETAFRQEPDCKYDPPHVGLSTSLRVLICPADSSGRYRRSAERYDRPDGQPRAHHIALTAYLGNAGTISVNSDGVLFDQSRVKGTDLRDGASHTLAVGERPPSDWVAKGSWYRGYGQGGNGSADVVLGVVEWNAVIDRCPANGYQFSPGRPDSICDLFHFWSLHAGGANFLFADGSVHFLRYEADAILPALATRAGDEVVTLPD